MTERSEAKTKGAQITATSLMNRTKGHQMRVDWKSISVSAAVVGVVLSMSGCATPPRVEVTQRDDYKLDCTQLESEFSAAQNVRGEAESLRGATANNILGAVFIPEAMKINYDSANASIDLAERRKERVMNLARDRKCPFVQS
jgi:hypothetical protein